MIADLFASQSFASRFSPSAAPENRARAARHHSQDIDAMSREDLVQLIRSTEPPFLTIDTSRRLPLLDDVSLRRMAHLSCRCCRQLGY